MSRAALSGGRFVKVFATAAEAGEAIRRSALARSAGVPTPGAQAGPNSMSVAFDRIDGDSGIGLVDLCGLAGLLGPLAALHRTPAQGLAPYDPFLRIRPRLAEAPDSGVDAALLARVGAGLPRGGVALHGDFHAGQLIRDSRGDVWIVDLDDMAVGPAEADLGNFAAHLATRPETGVAPLRTSLEHWCDRVCAAWPTPCDRGLVVRYMRIAALRRALKLRERGDRNLLPELLTLMSAA